MNTIVTGITTDLAREVLGEVRQAHAKGHELPEEEFRKIIDRVITSGTISRENLARCLMVSLSTIDRWQAGRGSTHCYRYRVILEAITKKIQKEYGIQ